MKGKEKKGKGKKEGEIGNKAQLHVQAHFVRVEILKGGTSTGQVLKWAEIMSMTDILCIVYILGRPI